MSVVWCAARAAILAGFVVALCIGSAASVSAAPATGEFIRAWQICGPFPARSVVPPIVADEAALNPVSHPTVAGKAWKMLKSDSGLVDLQSQDALGDVDHAVAFAYAEIESEDEGPVILGLGSDDSLAAWWNGRRVLLNDVLRGLHAGDDQVYVRMEKGRNELLLKVYDDGGGFGLAADLRPAGDRAWTWRAAAPLSDDELLELSERRAFEYFAQEADIKTGLMRDSALEERESRSPCSVASVGFGLTGLCIADARGWLPRGEAQRRVKKTLEFLLRNAAHEHGYFYHFLDMRTGERTWNSEASSIDTALLLGGVLTCRNYFRDRDITWLADQLYARVDWPWMLNGADTLAMAWTPESGFTAARWNSYNELMILYLLAMGSPAHPLPAGAWHAWSRPYYTYDGLTYVQGVPLFLHQYSHCWVDFRDKRDAYADYFRNSRLATMAHREFCLRLRDRFPKYSESLWGMTASKGPRGYAVWGGPPATTEHPPDGTVVPCAAGGSLPFAPDITLPVLREIHHNHRDQAWGKYGFLDAFNPHTGWSAKGYIGIDQGALLLMIENYRSGNVWKWFMESPEIERAMALAGFKDTARRLDPADLDYLRDLARDTWACIAHFVHPDTQMPYDNSERGPHTSVTNVGLYLAALAAAREMGFITAEEALRRAEILVGSIEKFPTWHGLHQCWHGVADLKPVAHDPWMSVVDSGNMAMGLAVAAQAFPELHDRCRGLLDAMDWSAIHDVNAGQLYGGYDMQNDKLNPDWRVDALATDSRGAAFMAIASGKVPSEIWSNLNRDMSDRHHVRYLQPGWTGGGLFMQYLTGIFLDERDTLAGRSAANLAYANMRQADELGSEVWGWSSCADPAGGYIGWGKLRDEVVTPHASVLAIGDYPREVFHNLLRLERMGARAPWQENGESFEFGFRDSLNWRTGDVAKGYLVLDQAMLFLSLANFLEDNLVRKWFHADPGVAAAVQKIPELAQPEGGDLVSVLEPGLGRIVTRPQVARQLEMPRVAEPPAIDGVLTEWTDERGRARLSFPEHLEFGFPANKDRFEAAARFAWDEKHLYIGVEVREDELVAEAPAAELYKDDAIELFLDPGNDGFVWGDAKDFQIGFSPSGPKGHPQVYAWFQKNPAPGVVVSSFLGGTPEGEDYVIEAAIPWEFLGVSGVRPGMTLPGSIAVHTVNRARTSSAKLNWSFRTESEQIRLGELKLVE